ncbi:hypothetical protein F7Q89_20485 [Vibrio kanaloae]|nr:hypothetical protein F7Q89_20485 [Vibrio kanaloae]OEF14290.1 hypothetical protein A132_10285 [Vibrio kanaloae 5S-149]
MSSKDLLDKTFDFIAHKTEWLYEQDLIKNWFNILSWTAITGFIFALFDHTHSVPLLVIGLTSSILIIFYAWHTGFDVVKRVYGGSESVSVWTMLILLAMNTAVPITVLFYMVQAIGYIVNSGT